MARTIRAFIEKDGTVHLLEPASVHSKCRAIVTILDEKEPPVIDSGPLARLSEASLAQDWNRPEEDAAWSHLSPAQ